MNYISEKWITLFVSILLATVYFLPTIGNLSADIGFSAHGDGGSILVPSLMNLSSLLYHNFSLQGIDWLTQNGSSEFFVRSNIPMLYPPLVACAALFEFKTFQQASIFCFFFSYIHMIICVFFVQILARKYFNFTFFQSVFLACFISFFYSFSYSLPAMPFYLAICLFPLNIFCTLYAAEKRSFLSVFLLSFLTFNYLFVGYLPLALAGVLLSTVFAVSYIYWINPERYNYRLLALVKPVISVMFGVLFAAPGILSIVHYVHYSEPIGMRGLSYAAYSISHSINKLAYLFVTQLPADTVEGFGCIGLAATLIIIAYFMAVKNKKNNHFPQELRLLQFSVVIFALTFLVQFGKNIHLSTIFYYFVPGLGDMHSYQRYSILSTYFLGIFIAIALNYIFSKAGFAVRKFMAGACFFAAILISLLLEFYAEKIGSSVYWSNLIVTLFLSSLLFASRFIFSKPGAWIVSSLMTVLLSLSLAYIFQKDYFVSDHLLLQAHEVENQEVINFFRANSNSEIIKYASITPEIFSYVPRNYPWAVQGDIKLSEYMGYELHISGDNNYRAHIPYYGEIDWSWLRRTGAEFIIYNDVSHKKYAEYIDQFSVPTISFKLSNGDTITKLNPDFLTRPPGYKPEIFNNGYILVSHTADQPVVSKFKANHTRVSFDIDVKDHNTRITLLFWPNRHLHLEVNGERRQWPIDSGLYTLVLDQGLYEVKFVYDYPMLSLYIIGLKLYILMLIIAAGLLIWKAYFNFIKGKKANEAQ